MEYTSHDVIIEGDAFVEIIRLVCGMLLFVTFDKDLSKLNIDFWEFLSSPLYDLIWQGPLAAVFDPVQVKSLIRALFQNTERRAEALSNIRLT